MVNTRVFDSSLLIFTINVKNMASAQVVKDKTKAFLKDRKKANYVVEIISFLEVKQFAVWHEDFFSQHRLCVSRGFGTLH